MSTPIYDPARLLADVLRPLSDAGIHVTVGANATQATAAARALLDALGVGVSLPDDPALSDSDPRGTPTHAAAGAAAQTAEPPGAPPAMPPGVPAAAAPAATPGDPS